MIHHVNLTLHGSNPRIWRRVEFGDDLTLGQLHWIIQIAMGWTNSHMHQFIIDGQFYADPRFAEEWGAEIQDEDKTTISQLSTLKKGSHFFYEYDFGDSWTHLIEIENITEPEPGAYYPRCTAGELACPPEDVGGIPGFYEFLEAMKNKKHPEHDMYTEWIGRKIFNAEYFPIDFINVKLSRLDFYRLYQGKQANYTPTQGQYLSFIYYYTKIIGYPPAQSDMQNYFKVSSASVSTMIKKLESLGLLSRVPGESRSIKLLLHRKDLPDLE